MPTMKEVRLPDIGDFKSVDVIEILVAPGDTVEKEQSLITLESDKATMEIPSPAAGIVRSLQVQVGDKVAEGAPILTLEVGAEDSGATSPGVNSAAGEAAPEPSAPRAEAMPATTDEPSTGGAPDRSAPLPGTPVTTRPPVPELSAAERTAAGRRAHASPAVRRFARELGVDLARVAGSGPKGRVLKDDVQGFIKQAMTRSAATAPMGLVVPDAPEIDFAKFGPIENRPLTRIQKKAAVNLHRSWITVPHVTQFDEADITELEEFRKAQVEKLVKQGVKLTMLSFLLKAAVVALKQYPEFNASLDPGGENLILKNYYHIGVAVDTNEGLVVPVVRNVDQKGLFQLAAELGEISARARSKKLTPTDMQGGSFTISSLGGIGGTAFTPIVNAPEVAILGIARAALKPVYEHGQFVPRLILPLSLSYDHRVIDGAAGARFTTTLRTVLSDIRHMLL